MHRTIIMGSPQEEGRCASIAQEIFDACIEDCPDDGVSIVSVTGVEVSGCIGCNACRKELPEDSPRRIEPPEKDDTLAQVPMVYKSNANAFACFMKDDMKTVRRHIDAADELIVVSPVYFAGAPSQLKALLDRMQPYFWSDLRTRTDARRPMTIHVLGDGDDPYGFEPLVSTVRSAAAMAGFSLESVFDWTGCIDDEGCIFKDAAEWDYNA